MKAIDLSLKQMIELDACTRCGECALSCPVYSVTNDRRVTPMEALQSTKDWALCRSGLRKLFLRPSMDQERLNAFSKEVFQCTLCGRCDVVCPVNIRTKEMRIALRRNMVRADLEFPGARRVIENLEKGKNIIAPTNDDRALWLQNMPNLSPEKYLKEKAEVVCFVGCVASLFPMTYPIPQSTLSLLDKANVDFSFLGTQEWCCGWPLIGMGREEKVRELMEHNIETVNAMSAKTLLFSCPSCYYVWKHLYPRLSPREEPRFELLHSTEYFLRLLKEEKIPLYPLEATVTYHDPCDLGRGLGIYEPPRDIIRMIPGLHLVEMEKHKSHATCCGGGGDLEMFYPDITRDIAGIKIGEIEKTGAELVLSACQQCKRTISVNAKKLKKKFKVLDLTELILALSEPGKNPLASKIQK